MQRILVVEDDSAMRAHFLELLAEVPDVEIDSAASEEEARAHMDKNRYDLAVLDIELGQTALSRLAGMKLAEDKAATVALFVSGTSDTTVRSLASYLWGYDFVSKPFEDIDFVVKVKRALDIAKLAISTTPSVKLDLPPDLERDPNNQTKFLWKRKEVRLSLTELSIVDLLARAYGTVVPHSTLVTALPSGRDANALASHIRNIRQKFIDTDHAFVEIRTEPGRGYIWDPRGQG